MTLTMTATMTKQPAMTPAMTEPSRHRPGHPQATGDADANTRVRSSIVGRLQGSDLRHWGLLSVWLTL